MKSILNHNINREFKFSIGRFISIIILLALGTFVLVGLKVTGFDMRQSANNYYAQQHLADAQVTSNTGISHADQEAIRNLSHVKTVEFTTYRDAVIKGGHDAIRLQAKTKKLSTNAVVKGRLPEKNNEIALSNSERHHYKIGDTFKVVDNNGKSSVTGLQNTRFTVVGFVNSSVNLQKNKLGSTTAGTGQIATFAVVNKDVFSSATPTLAEITYDNTSGPAYSEKFENQVQKNVDQAQSKLNTMAKSATTKTLNRLNVQSRQIKTAQSRLTYQMTTLKGELAELKTSNGTGQQRTKLKQTQRKLAAEQQKLATEATTISTAKRQLTSGSGVVYQIQSRNDFVAGYNQFGEDADRIDSLSNSFPIIFFAVAILVTLTTMSRMAEQKRIELGTLRALGYTKYDAMKVFLLYGVLAGLIGSIIGSIFGTSFLPTKIFEAYAANVIIPNFETSPSTLWIAISVVISILVATLPALVVAARSLREVPATLMLPKPPKKGTKVLLERLPFIWNHFSFNYKVTVRNLARYKSRMFMTIIGVLGCTALLVTGFGIRDSLTGLVSSQYQNIVHYDLIGVYNSQASSQSISDYKKVVDHLDGVKSKTNVYYESMTTRPKGTDTNQSISMIVPQNTAQFGTYVTLQNPTTKAKLRLGNNGAIVTEKLAKLTGVHQGDYLTIENVTGDKTRVKIAGISKMYAGHNLYMSSTYYRKAFGEAYATNAVMLRLKDRSSSNSDRVSSQLNQQKAALTTIQSDDVKTMINNILHGLNNLVLIITIAASALAFVVLFTLTNINVSERIRELSTIKVLGFYPFEVIMYVYRETLFLTLIGILTGYVGGAWLHQYIMQTLPPATAMVDMTLRWTNIGISGGLTLLFSILVMAMMARKISQIDMLEALKSVD
ncbi:FtsX-like permease family protein [Secundilactobacillus kimchicus]|uniref:FtsX-like permease family protein n=1 Tax=Secundilactobacillus kimchicus TaxID=528209 RepID=UPI001C02747B|nr:FtsX-like permease family protein [Secundilactobacillus kimchicus]MBT9672554.1 FtsX-like permease family protein [Secundilactobacillus kimchicus]